MREGYATEEKATAYRKSVRKDYGQIVSIDITTKFLKEFLQAEMYAKNCPPIEDEGLRETWAKAVTPFFEHMSEVLDTLD